jgi:hypothetical protein
MTDGAGTIDLPVRPSYPLVCRLYHVLGSPGTVYDHCP